MYIVSSLHTAVLLMWSFRCGDPSNSGGLIVLLPDCGARARAGKRQNDAGGLIQYQLLGRKAENKALIAAVDRIEEVHFITHYRQ
jgi:hypothetical protein